jgi:hypothetical protein
VVVSGHLPVASSSGKLQNRHERAGEAFMGIYFGLKSKYEYFRLEAPVKAGDAYGLECGMKMTDFHYTGTENSWRQVLFGTAWLRPGNKRRPKRGKQINNRSVIYDRILEVAKSFLFAGLAWSSTYSTTLNPLLIGRSSEGPQVHSLHVSWTVLFSFAPNFSD